MNTKTLKTPATPEVDLTTFDDHAHAGRTGRASAVVYFAGGGGDLAALEAAGCAGGVQWICNHWEKALQVADNAWLRDSFRGAKYMLGDLSTQDPSGFGNLGDLDLWIGGSECDGHRQASSLDEARKVLRPYLGPEDPRNGRQRSRATMYCFQLAAQQHRPKYVLIENVVGVSTWAPFKSWIDTWGALGYNLTWSCQTSAAFGVPQDRSRVLLCASRKDMPVPNFDWRPPCFCHDCGVTVHGIQTWKKAALKRAHKLGLPQPIGVYGPRGSWQYHCPDCTKPVSLWIVPVAEAIEWDRPIERIGDRAEPLAPNTMARIERGAVKFGWLESTGGNAMLTSQSFNGSVGGKVRPAWLPAFTQTARQDMTLVVDQAMQVDLRNHSVARGVDEVGSARCSGGEHHSLVFRQPAFVQPNMTNNAASGVDEPGPTVTSGNRNMVVAHPQSMLVAGAGHTFEREPAEGKAKYARAWDGNGPAPVVHATNDKALVVAPPAKDGFCVANFGGNGNGHERRVGEAPSGTLTAGGQHALVTPPESFLTGFYSRGDSSRSTQEPSGTVMSTDHHGVVTSDQAFLDSYYSGGDVQRGVEEPAGTLTSTDRHAVVQRPGFLARAGGATRADVLDPLGPSNTVLPTDDYGVVKPSNAAPEPSPALDLDALGFRMLTPSENQRIQDLHVRLKPTANGRYEITPLEFLGSNRDRTALAGNGVPRRLMQFHIERCLQAIGR